jgi:hypothetical protein
MAVVDVGLRLDARDWEKKLKSLGNLSDSQAKAMAKAMAQAGRATESTADSADRARRALSDMGEAGAAAGGNAAKLAGILDLVAPGLGQVAQAAADAGDVLEVAGEASRALGPAILAVGVALGGAALAFAATEREIVREATAVAFAREQHSLLVPTLRAVEDASIALAVATGELSQAQGRQAATAVAAQRAVLDLGAQQAQAAAALRGEAETAQRWLDLTTSILPRAVNPAAQLADAVFGWSASIADSDRKLQALGDTVEQEAAAQTDLRDILLVTASAQDAATAATRAGSDASRAAAEAVAEEARQRAAILSMLRDAEQAERDLQGMRLDAEQAGSRLAAIEAERGRRLDAAADAATRLALAQGEQVAEAELLATQAAIEADTARQVDEARLQALATLSAAQEQAHREQLARLERERSAIVGGISQGLGAIASLAGTAAEQQSEAQADAALRLFRLQKAAAIAQVGVDQSVALIKALATLGPVAGAIAAGGIVAAGAASVAAIAAQEPPTFHRGGPVRPREVAATLEAGEGVLTRRGMAAAGGEGGLRQLNQGQSLPAAVQVVAVDASSPLARGGYQDALRVGILRRATVDRLPGRRRNGY